MSYSVAMINFAGKQNIKITNTDGI